MTDEHGTITWQSLPADEWGAVVASSAHVDSILRTGMQLNIRLPGQYFDAETGLHDNHHRTYDPRANGYLQPDPLGSPGDPDSYRYVGGDPVNKVDPTGLYEEDVHYYLTFFLARAAGLSETSAYQVALAAQFVDDNPLTTPVRGVYSEYDRTSSLPLYTHPNR